MSLSLDGFVCDANGKNDWIFKTGDEESMAWSVEKSSDASLLIMGRKSFEMMAPYWPTATGPFAAPMNQIPKALFTKKGFKGIKSDHAGTVQQTAAAASWAEAKVFDGDLAEEIMALKADSGKPIVAFGGAGFMQSLIATGLIDEYHLAIHPVVLGSGLPIFTGCKVPFYLKLAEVKAFPGGVVALTYRV